jgi:hypothetical protein
MDGAGFEERGDGCDGATHPPQSLSNDKRLRSAYALKFHISKIAPLPNLAPEGEMEQARRQAQRTAARLPQVACAASAANC